MTEGADIDPAISASFHLLAIAEESCPHADVYDILGNKVSDFTGNDE